ncbi:MAG: hypothetical protein K6T56_07440 [Burkholderiales bacterium]|nr:hypothetical protein [Burkholderiales bacterium]
MGPFAHDQAEGLRRLLQPDFLRVIAFCAAREGVGRTALVENLALTLARRGRRVLVLCDAPEPPVEEVAPPPRHDLTTVLRGQKRLAEIVRHGGEGIGWLVLGQAMEGLARLDASSQEALAAEFAALAEATDFALLLPRAGETACALTLAAQEIVLVTTPEARAITLTYGLLKRLAQGFALRRFHLVVTKVKAGLDGQAIYNNLQHTAGRFLGVRLDWLGKLAADAQVGRARRLGRGVVTAFPDSVATQDCRALAEAMEAWPRPEGELGRAESLFHRLVTASRLATL